MKKLLAGLFALFLTLGGFSGVNVASAADTKNCSDFETKEEVQQFWNENGYGVNNDPHGLDGNNNNGVPCESLPSGDSDNQSNEESNTEEPASEETSSTVDKDCKHFASQEEAQAYWDENGFTKGNDPQRLDRDGDAIPCEDDEGAASSSDEQGTSTEQDDTATAGNDSEEVQGGELPNTSTSYAGYTLFGLALIVLGGGLFAFRKRIQ
ncbi:excalibur calcium-binding domain-containing protein [Halobacillus naozhouensis]|uniref:Excalibur calcium-binding domain-containing protein n=1 Tax=Halobacillus naozhouensis TaxID=554880 RepID=A0ABY8J1K5_9BACI|nr:excalibur calcium-binding domain-containing protein [Halobacillus naozhouensis]WFT76383.1 excalibur calcium-binding domain-containing protein [Halobacillus naozhouensis]